MNLYLIEINEKDVRLLDKCLKIAKAELSEVSKSDGLLSDLAKELSVDISNLSNRINEQIRRR